VAGMGPPPSDLLQPKDIVVLDFFFPLFRASLDEPYEQAFIKAKSFREVYKRALLCAARLTSSQRAEDITQEALAAVFSKGDGTEARRWNPRKLELIDHTNSVTGSVAATANRARDRHGNTKREAKREPKHETERSPQEETVDMDLHHLKVTLLEAKLDGDTDGLDVFHAKMRGIEWPRDIAAELRLTSTQVENALKRIAHHVSVIKQDLEEKDHGQS
jgi:hypothetical protein